MRYPPFRRARKQPFLGLAINHHLKWWLLTNDIIPIVDLHEKFYREPFPISGYSFYAIFILDEKLIAVPVNGVDQYYDVPSECLFPIPMILNGERGQCIQQIINLDGRLIQVISLKHIFEEMEDDIWEKHNKDYS